ncbi:S23 ribosomal [Hydrogenimonas sp.]|nr:S23 ribosomal [Hydrogenimonas sp.]
MKCENMDVWKKSASVSSEIYLQLREFKDFSFKDQLTRSGLSVPSNIAEWLERKSEQEKIRFLDIARASIAEAKTQIYIGMKIDYIPVEKGKSWIAEYESIGKMLTALINSIQNRSAEKTDDH